MEVTIRADQEGLRSQVWCDRRRMAGARELEPKAARTVRMQAKAQRRARARVKEVDRTRGMVHGRLGHLKEMGRDSEEGSEATRCTDPGATRPSTGIARAGDTPGQVGARIGVADAAAEVVVPKEATKKDFSKLAALRAILAEMLADNAVEPQALASRIASAESALADQVPLARRRKAEEIALT